MTSSFSTCDLCDAHPDDVRVLEPVFAEFGGRGAFHGPVATAKCFEDNSMVREAVSEPGNGRVLIVDGGASLRRSLLGGDLAAKATANGWAGIVIDGAARDGDELAACALGVRARALIPMKTVKRGEGVRDIPVRVAGQTVAPGDHLYADRDGIIVAARALHTP
ncbi:MAG: ribonuclease E activity regulator RraA [Caulobacterales bacterium]|nr:ribonuclease E activity regulator RraA [Caulobacterales bacterium]